MKSFIILMTLFLSRGVLAFPIHFVCYGTGELEYIRSLELTLDPSKSSEDPEGYVRQISADPLVYVSVQYTNIPGTSMMNYELVIDYDGVKKIGNAISVVRAETSRGSLTCGSNEKFN